MNRLALGAVVLALTSGTAFAQSAGYERHRNGPPPAAAPAPAATPAPAAAPAPAAPTAPAEQRNQTFRPGDTVPYDLRSGGHHIQYDWQAAGLSSPPNGFAWMAVGNQFVLADQNTGLIREVRPGPKSTKLVLGGTVPYEDRVGGHKIVYDWRGAGLSEPPKGYAWMKVDDQYVLADQQSGKIDDIKPLKDSGRRD